MDLSRKPMRGKHQQLAICYGAAGCHGGFELQILSYFWAGAEREFTERELQ